MTDVDDVLVGLVVPVAGDEPYGPGAGERPMAQDGAGAVLLHNVEVTLVVHVGAAEAARRDGEVVKPLSVSSPLRH